MIKGLLLLTIIYLLFFNNILVTSNYTNILNNKYAGECSGNKNILVVVLDKTINETTNSTSIAILYKIKRLIEKLDFEAISKLIHNIQCISKENKKYKDMLDNLGKKGEYYSRKRIAKSKLLITENTSKNSLVIYRNTTYSTEKDVINLKLIVVNIISIASFIIGLYVFKIIKKRIDYI